MNRFYSAHLLIIPLLVVFWIAFLSFNAQRIDDVVDAYRNVQLQVVRKAAHSGEEVFAQGATAENISMATLEKRFMGQVIQPVQLLRECNLFVTRDRHVFHCTLPEFSPSLIGHRIRDMFDAQIEKGASDYDTLIAGVDAGTKGTTSFVWSKDRGTEHTAWASFRVLGQTWTIGASTPESAILAFSGIPNQIRRETTILAAISALFLLIMAVLARQQRLSVQHQKKLKSTVDARTSELTKANQRLRSSEEKYRLLVEHQNDVVVKINSHGRLEFVSPSYCDLIGKPESDMLGSRFIKMVHKEDRRKAYIATRNLDTPPHSFLVEARMHTREGVRWLSWTGKGVPSKDGAPYAEIVGIGRDITDMVLARERIANSLTEKEVLLQEVHHRVKNNLQIICSLLDMASRRLHSPLDQELFQDVHSKIEGMSLIHTQLYQSEHFDSIDIGEYTTALFEQLAKMFSRGNVELELDADKVYLPINRAIPCGLVLNEALTNVFKHAYATGLGGKVSILLKNSNGQVRLRIADDGPGLPEDWETRGAKSMGMKLMRNIVEFQLGGSLMVNTGPNSAFDINFPADQN
ncbi:sensor histidine kinase [Desulfovibrio ferrophilus]|uniref:histidine kinase n=1 Tax=Desulfovibrio ferrophilus TaxID=241368 RepID=A0A2Z6B3F2_9BACT|nr:histidine kinase dimerization/phosphoacceptor domain -containing protein [Desulfovibrio ferrophilus]BBD09975.1 sensory transduction regulatory protein [Desulfovibrio ferrophilus]